jgi:hypothetical protein
MTPTEEKLLSEWTIEELKAGWFDCNKKIEDLQKAASSQIQAEQDKKVLLEEEIGRREAVE